MNIHIQKLECSLSSNLCWAVWWHNDYHLWPIQRESVVLGSYLILDTMHMAPVIALLWYSLSCWPILPPKRYVLECRTLQSGLIIQINSFFCTCCSSQQKKTHNFAILVAFLKKNLKGKILAGTLISVYLSRESEKLSWWNS